ncbi:ABC transporter ATP-binding protein [Hoeflea sp. YIM 152468]|uniref:ABC transporter ATP-binding protein n=1 Tax=Hoeflea sp. YIM 152468 TaxID=3031759 RepID=UPI0023DBCF20|nr:ABC transporter ATP-binding protein [Hoeflea sp. YIM 152468]MDF1609699.1 ABC transporter ATP-binding protein [Hoeflea sp. YIM 152468]
MIFRPLLDLFEGWIDPFVQRSTYRPPRSTAHFLWHYVSQARGAFAAMLALGGLVALLEAALFYFVGRLVDVLDAADPDAGWDGLIASHGQTLAFMLFVVVLARFVVVTVAALVEEQTVVPGFYNMVRWQAHAHVSRQNLAFFQNDFTGRIVTKVWSSGQATGDFMVSLLQVVWFIMIYTATTMALVAQLDWRLSALVLVWIVVFGFLARFFVPRIRRHARASAEASAMLSGRITDSYSNIQTLKLYAREADNDRYIREGFDQFIAAILPFTRHLTGVRAALAALSGMMIAVIAGFSINLWLAGAISVGSVAFTLSLVLRLNMLLGRMMTQLNSLMRNLGTVQNSADLVARPIGLSDREGAGALKVTNASIRFERVSFGYGSKLPVIDDLSLSIGPGEKLGLVGRSGAGKSTFVNLLLRFYDLESGRIEIDGQNIADVSQESLRQAIGMVTQDTSLLHRSIRENIVFGRPDADDAEILEAARRAEALDFIQGLSDQRGRSGLDAHVGDRGVKLSGGQRQRIAIARVMLKNAPILVLDEATSALDSEVEAAIQANLDELMRGKTVIAIAHRLSTIARMDRLVVMDNGRILELGSHAQLIARGGLYADLWARQSGGFIGVDEAAE